MSKRRKIQVSEENKEEGLSKPKKNSRKKIHLTRESDLESLTQASQTRHSLSIPEVYEERKEHLEEGQELSSAKLPKDYSECKELDDTKVALPSSQNRKIVPTFTKSKKSLLKRPEKCFKETATANGTEEDQHLDENVSRTANTIQNPVTTSAESSMTKMESARDQIIPQCDGINERLDIKIQDKCGIRETNTIDAALGLSASQPEVGIEPHSQASSREEEMSQKQVPFSLRGSSSSDVNNSEKEALSLEPLTCQPAKQMNVSQLPGDESIDCIKSGRNEEGGPDSSGTNVQQDKPRQMILEADETDEPETSGIMNGNGKDLRDSEGMASLRQKVADGMQLPVIEDVVIPTPGKWNPSPCTTPCADRQKNADVEETEGLPDKSGEAEEQNDNCAGSNSEISAPEASKSVPIKNASNRRNLETNGQLVEKGIRRVDSGRKDSTPAEQNSIKNQNISHVQPVDPCLEKEVDHSQPIWDQLILKDGLILPQVNGDVLPERRNIFLEDRTACVKERMDNSAEANVPALLTQRENAICSEPLVLNSQQSENNLMIDNVMSAVPSGNVEKTVQVSTAEPKTGENVFFAVDLHTADEEPAQGEGNGCSLNQGESNLPSVESLPPWVLGDPNEGVHARSKMQGTSAAYGPDPGLGAPKDLDAVAQAYSPCPDPFSLDLESLPDAPWEDLLESQAVEFQSPKTCALKDLQTCCKDKSNQHATRKLKGENKIPPPDSTGAHANNVRDEMKTICDPSKQEDATEVVYGLIKELSNLNRLTMSTHRDLDSFKRLQSRRSKYGRLPSHGLNHMTSMAGTVKKKREL